jgi:NAD(P)-dependent dehydrogenase (short-subunit alcohol dehydrogenase family)
MLATELALKGVRVRVNAIAPGVYESEMTSDNITGEEAVNSAGKGIQPIPAKRAGTSVFLYVIMAWKLLTVRASLHRAQEMAGTAVYLASLAGCYTNGQEIVIDGGYLMVNPSTK